MTGEPSNQRFGATSLMYACQQGKEGDVIKIINAKPRSVNERERSLKTALHYCAESGDGGVKSAQALLDASPQLVSSQDQDGYSPLHLAVIAGNIPLARLLLSRGAPVNAPDNEGHTPAHWATVCGEIDSLELVLSKGGNPNLGDMHGGCPLHYAAQMCGPGSEMPADRRLGMAALRILLDKGADPNLPDNHGRQPILWAASAGSSEAILVLVNAGASVEAADKDGLTALHCAGSRGHTDCVETLISLCNAEVDVIDNNGCSALFYAVTLGHADATQSLLNHGANTNRQDRKGRTTVHCGAAKGQIETLKVVGNWGGNLWQRTVRGDYPLHDAVASGRIALVQWLLNDRPDAVNAPNNDGRCPLHVASIHNNIEMCKALLDSGSLVNPVMRTSKGALATPLDTALHKGHRGCAKYLQLHGGVPASRLNSESAGLRGLNSRILSTHSEAKNESDDVKVNETTEVKESKNVTNDTNATTITTHKEITMSSRPRILQVYVEDDVMIRRIRHHEGSDSSIEERVRRRRRKRKTKKLSEKDHNIRGDVSAQKKQSLSSEENTDSLNERPKSSRQHVSEGKVNLDQIVQTEALAVTNESGLQGTESVSIQTELKESGNGVMIASIDEDYQIVKNVSSDYVGITGNEETTINPEMTSSEQIVTPEKLNPNVQIITAIVHSEAEPFKNNEEESIVNDSIPLIDKENGKVETSREDNSIQPELEENTALRERTEEIYSVQQSDVPEKDDAVEDEIRSEQNEGKKENESNIDDDRKSDTGGSNVHNLATETLEVGEKINDALEIVPNISENFIESENPNQDLTKTNEQIDTEVSCNNDGVIEESDVIKETVLQEKEDGDGKSMDDSANEDDNLDVEISSHQVIDSKESEIKENGKELAHEIDKANDVIINEETADPSLHNELQQKMSFDEPENEDLKNLMKNEMEKKVIPIDSTMPNDNFENEPFKVLNDDDDIARTLINSDKGLIKVLDDDINAQNDNKDEKRRKMKKRREDRNWRKGRSRESFEVLNLPTGLDDNEDDLSQSTKTLTGGESPHLLDSGIEPSPRRDRGSAKRSKSKDRSRIPRVCRKGHESEQETTFSTVSVTQAVQYSVRKYHLERRIFHQLLELKRLQIRAGRASEAVLVKRLVDDYRRAGLMLGLQQYDGVYTFRSFEKYLYEQLRLLQSSEKRIIPRLKSTDDLERLTAALKKTRAGQEILASVPNNPALCTYRTHRCHHATHAYTGIPCAAYITKSNHHTMQKPAPYTGFLPKLVNDENHGEVAKTLRYVDPSRPLTLELSHGPDKQIITLPTEKLDKSKRYFVTFTIKSGEQKKNVIKHNHSTSI
ncbi:ankycorbin [Cimex lectularius]|uniref:Uncharacterized protein n=1 Tax=Cimex lectularius TaxID=79782 RepID=A0A8I6RNU0_CIMLE|nr:ankycorbin [Cimex lectularius]XP_014247328.1 ankycorbin [Cimex lectularius]